LLNVAAAALEVPAKKHAAGEAIGDRAALVMNCVCRGRRVIEIGFAA